MQGGPVIRGVQLVQVPKTGGTRWLTHLDAMDDAAYAAAVAPIVPLVERSLLPTVVANRVQEVTRDPPSIRLEGWQQARRRFRGMVADLAPGSGAILLADVRSCYAEIGAQTVGSALQRLGCRAREVRSVLAAVRTFGTHGVEGLPIGPAPSAVLANAVLAEVDERLSAGGYRYVRWVDDVMVFADGAASAESALRVLERTLVALGLRLAEEKTRLLDTPAAIRSAGAGPHSCA